VRKPGHALAEIATDFPETLLEGLRKQFSITTAEELISADRISGDRLRESLAIEQSTWKDVIGRVLNVLPADQVRRLTTAMPARPGGVKLGKLSSDQIRRYAPGLSRK
jgi:hypothetical protein